MQLQGKGKIARRGYIIAQSTKLNKMQTYSISLRVVMEAANQIAMQPMI